MGVSQQSFAPTTTGELLSKAPSAATRRTSAINMDTRLRGLNSGQINASADGATQYKTRIDIDSQLSAIDPGIIDPYRGITVIDGPYDSRYGLGYGFLIANLLETPRSDSGLAADGSILFQYNTNGRGMYTRETLMGGGEYWGFVFSYGYRQANDYYAGSNNIDFKIPASYNTWNGYLAGGIDLTSNSRLEVSYLRDDRNNVELPGVIYDINFQKDDQFNARYIIQDDRNGPQNFILQYWHGRTDFDGDSTRESKHRTFYDQFITANFFGSPNPGLRLLDVANTFVSGMLENQGIRSLMTFGETGGPQWTVGADWRYYQQYYQEQHESFVGMPFTLAFGEQTFGIATSSMNDYGLLSHAVIPMADDRIVATVGGRLDFTRAFLANDAPNNPPANPPLGIQTNPFPGDGKPNEILSMVYATTDFQIVRYEEQFNSGFSVVPGIAYGMRNPTLSELYTSGAFVPLVRSGNAFAIGQSQLTPERNFQTDLSFVHRGTSDSMVRLARLRGFVSNIDNYILYYPLIVDGTLANTPFQSVTYQYANIERATLAGADLMAEIQLSRYVGLYGSIAYVKGTNHSPLINVGAPDDPVPLALNAEALPGIYPLNGVLGLTLSDSEEETPTWGVSMLSRMTRGQEYIARSLFDQRTPGWSTFDLVGFYRINDNVRFTSSVENIFDFLYTQHGSLAVVDQVGNYSLVKDPGVTLRMGIQIDF